jgi:hypothetical protein
LIVSRRRRGLMPSDSLITDLESVLERLKAKQPREPKNLTEAEQKAREVVRASRREEASEKPDVDDEESKDAKGDEAKTP